MHLGRRHAEAASINAVQWEQWQASGKTAGRAAGGLFKHFYEPQFAREAMACLLIPVVEIPRHYQWRGRRHQVGDSATQLRYLALPPILEESKMHIDAMQRLGPTWDFDFAVKQTALFVPRLGNIYVFKT
jgi:hypothetical protein